MPTVERDRDRVERVVRTAFERRGIGPDDAAVTADALVTAEARGKDSHGLVRVPRYVRGVEHGTVDPDGEITVAREAGATATLDGGSRFGPAVAVDALGEATARADAHGVGVVGVRDSTHLGALGYYTDRVRRDGYVTVALTNTEPAVAPHGGTEPVLGTNPIAVGLPTDPPFNLDMSTAAVARGSLETAAERGDAVPEGVAVDAAGRLTTDPEAALSGTILPFGGAKGAGLALAVEVLAGGLVGASMGRAVTGTYDTTQPCTKGDLFVAVDPAALGGPRAVERIEAFLDRLTDEPSAPGETVRLPGQASLAAEDPDSVRVEDGVWERVRDLGA
jgi:L-2-hydroxycarboxylate dehydrogenase (NAD+)